jgi:cell division protein FtsB
MDMHKMRVTLGHDSRPRIRVSLLACGLIVCPLSMWQGAVAARPFVFASEMRAQNDRLYKQVLQYKLQNQRTERSIRMLERPQGIEREARKLGYVKPNEQRLRIPDDSN